MSRTGSVNGVDHRFGRSGGKCAFVQREPMLMRDKVCPMLRRSVCLLAHFDVEELRRGAGYQIWIRAAGSK
jgi:hypothetical protein